MISAMHSTENRQHAMQYLNHNLHQSHPSSPLTAQYQHQK